MKQPNSFLFILILSVALMSVGCLGFIPHSFFNIAVVTTAILGESSARNTPTLVPTLPEDLMTPTPVFTLPPDYLLPTLVPTLPEDYLLPTPVPTAFPTPTADPQLDVYGQVYFTLSGLDEIRLVRLPGACVLGLHICSDLETIQTPFDMKNVFNKTKAGMPWSLDGRYAALTTHPNEALLESLTRDELEQLRSQNPADYEVNPSTLFIYDAQWNSWKEIYRADQKYIYTGIWSPDGEWLSFAIYSSVGGVHPLQADDGIYIIHPDGSGLRQLENISEGNILGWSGSNLVVQHTLTSSPTWRYRIEMLNLDGQVKNLFESSRIARYQMDPRGISLLATDIAIMDAPVSQKAVDLLTLDGIMIHPFDLFNNLTSNISAGTWSSDGSQVAFSSRRWVYVAPRDGLSHEVYAADDRFVENPSITNIQFSHNQKYLLMQVDDGRQRLVSVSLEDGQAKTFQWPGMNDLQQPSQFSWQP